MSTKGAVTVSSPTHSSAVAGTVATPPPAAGTTAPTATPVQAHGASPAPSAEAKRPSNFRKTYYHHLNVGTKGGKGVDAAAFSGGGGGGASPTAAGAHTTDATAGASLDQGAPDAVTRTRSASSGHRRHVEAALAQPLLDRGDLIRMCRAHGMPRASRCVLWKVLLNILPREREEWSFVRKQLAESYEDVKSTCMLLSSELMPKAPSGSPTPIDAPTTDSCEAATSRLKKDAKFLEALFVSYQHHACNQRAFARPEARNWALRIAELFVGVFRDEGVAGGASDMFWCFSNFIVQALMVLRLPQQQRRHNRAHSATRQPRPRGHTHGHGDAAGGGGDDSRHRGKSHGHGHGHPPSHHHQPHTLPAVPTVADVDALVLHIAETHQQVRHRQPPKHAVSTAPQAAERHPGQRGQHTRLRSQRRAHHHRGGSMHIVAEELPVMDF